MASESTTAEFGMPVLGELYALHPDHEKGFRFYRLSDLDGVVSVAVDTARPDERDLPTVRLYCTNSDCVVREVTASMKLYGDPQPKSYVCPVCRGPMDFHGYQERRTLFPTRVITDIGASEGKVTEVTSG